jgi:hypothetical protein
MAWGGIEPPTQGFSILAAFLSRQESKSHSPRSFGNDFGKKGQRSPLALLIPIDLAEAVRFELTEDSHPRQFSRLLHSTTLPSFQNSGDYKVSETKRHFFSFFGL